MSWKETLSEKLSAYINAEFNYVETKDINDATKIDYGCSGIYMESTIIYFEIKNIPYLLKEHGRRKVALLYTMFKEAITAIVEPMGAFVNCFGPNAFLIVYPGNEETMSKAVVGALKITHLITEELKQQFTFVNGIEFSMGLDHGHIMGSKNLSDNGNDHITWFGTCVYKAIRIARECSRPFYVGISGTIYHSLGEDLRIVTRRILGIKKNVEMWSRVSYQYDNVKKHLYQTNHKISPEEA